MFGFSLHPYKKPMGPNSRQNYCTCCLIFRHKTAVKTHLQYPAFEEIWAQFTKHFTLFKKKIIKLQNFATKKKKKKKTLILMEFVWKSKL